MVKNASQLPDVYFGIHFVPGVAEYKEEGKSPFRIFLNEDTIRKMSPSFKGRPVYVQHVDEVDLKNIQSEADGYVVKSFYNAADGKTWVEFLVVSDKGHQAIKNGWKLSNAYVPTAYGQSGVWNGVEYQKEVLSAEFDHLAIVEDPRYAESVIMSEAEFKAYNEQKQMELKKLSNSKEEKKMGVLNLWKKSKVENVADLEGTMVELPLSKKSMTISQVVNELDKVLNMHGYASEDHMVKVNDKEEMSVKDLRDCYGKMKSEMDSMKKNEEVEEPVEGEELGEKEEKKLYPNAADVAAAEEKEKAAKERAERVKNANKKVEEPLPVKPITNGVERGKKLFGSN